MSGRAIDKIIAHYAATKDKRHCIKSPAWGLDVWCSPWTLGEKDRVFGGGEGWRHRSHARLLVVKAQDEAGRPLFADVEETELLNEADPAEVMRVAGAMLLLLNEDNAAAADGGDSPKA
ncbi:hypothetical protein [Reyranella sp.]|uniref:hypothetical protein n=1 Tax=Reyranella sp. TaxID=1929291 RepID=UPI003C7AA431